MQEVMPPIGDPLAHPIGNPSGAGLMEIVGREVSWALELQAARSDILEVVSSVVLASVEVARALRGLDKGSVDNVEWNNHQCTESKGRHDNQHNSSDSDPGAKDRASD